jgi:hypothetical protein
MWWCCNVPLTHVMPLQSTSTYVQWIPTVENVLESLLWGFTPVTLLAKHSTIRRPEPDVMILRLAPDQLEETDVWPTNGPGRSPARRVTFPAQRGGENRSPRVDPEPNVESTTSASLPSKPSSAPQTGFARKKSFKSQILDLSSCTVQEYIYVGGIDPLVAAIACESSFSTAILTHGLLLFSRVPIHRRFKGWYKGLKSRVVQVKYEEKGVTLLWI